MRSGEKINFIPKCARNERAPYYMQLVLYKPAFRQIGYRTHLHSGLGGGLQVLQVVVVRRGLQLAHPALLRQRLVDGGLGLARGSRLDRGSYA